MVNEGLCFQVELLELLGKNRVFLGLLLSYFLFSFGNCIQRQSLLKTWWLCKERFESILPTFGDLSLFELRAKNDFKLTLAHLLESSDAFLRLDLIFCQTLDLQHILLQNI